MADGAAMRIDRFLWWSRLAKTRSAAQAIAEKGMLRIDGRRVERSSAPVRVGCVVAFPLYGKVRVIRVELLPARRGPPGEGRACYQDLVVTENVSQEAPTD
ncbi:RNA-binding protein [Sphingomonas sp. IBVSS2]|uniref:RNA-binding S4 domain-containing protein n=1 Tax=Sphingomonas sp. IBVSS2 TaxID=1985172 RepID=UPI000A2E73EB|nr:S4 domain-containing protein [Sphingomonas sp. IBVSS2]OSZ69583.1 RNA-binding protein [Sphingomonas sp. IBVSS2]